MHRDTINIVLIVKYVTKDKSWHCYNIRATYVFGCYIGLLADRVAITPGGRKEGIGRSFWCK